VAPNSELTELILSLAWMPHSAYHARNVRDILERLCPDGPHEQTLAEYLAIVESKPGPGSPKDPTEQSLLAEARRFIDDVRPSDAAGFDWLLSLKARIDQHLIIRTKE